MPSIAEAVRYAADPNRSTDELRRACTILGLAHDGEPEELRARLEAHLSALDPRRPVLCLHPGPVRRDDAPIGTRVPRPSSDEYAPAFAAEIQLVPDALDFAALLEGQLEVTRSFVITFGEAHADLRYGPGKWSVRETVGHIADCERVLSYRLLRVLRGDATPVPGFDHGEYVTAGRFESRTLSAVVDELAAVRSATVALVRSAEPDDFGGRLPVGSGAITGRALAYLIAGHELHHQELLRTRYLPHLPDLAS